MGPQVGRKMERLTVNEAAQKLRISNEAVRKRVQRGTLPHGKRVDGSVYVCLDDEDYPNEEVTQDAWYATLWKGTKENATLIGAILALCGVLITQIMSTRTAELGRLQTAMVQDQQAQETSLQTYLGDIGDLLLKHDLRVAPPASEVRLLARAKTLAVLQVLNDQRKKILLLFLSEQELIGASRTSEFDPVVNLAGANLSGADLAEEDFSAQDLSETNLARADLVSTNFADAYLANVNFADADLREANLARAYLVEVDFAGADLRDADLREANLAGAYLRGAKMEGAKLSDTNLEGAIMPDGSRHE
jgi:hypothetical protein